MNSKTLAVLIRDYLRGRGFCSATEMVVALKVSQPSISRGIKSLGDECIRIGKGRYVRYAVTRDIDRMGSEWPLFIVSEDGNSVERVGVLHAIDGGWLFRAEKYKEILLGDEFETGHFDDLPWFLNDLRPQGFLGRLQAKVVAPILNVPDDIRRWSSDDVLLYLLKFGHDLKGDFILGDLALKQFNEGFSGSIIYGSSLVLIENRAKEYLGMARSVINGEFFGASAEGEQPKFTCRVINKKDVRYVIVKFSPDINSLSGRRWADLLMSEHHAAEVLRDNDIPAARTEIIESGDRVFLESQRFDRTGDRGRTSMISLGAFDDAFFGERDTPWSESAKRMCDSAYLSDVESARLKIISSYGGMIANTDMHYGNISISLLGGELILAPVYDMLPMFYAPLPSGDMSDRVFNVGGIDSSDECFGRASSLASEFWERVSIDSRISEGFRSISKENLKLIKSI